MPLAYTLNWPFFKAHDNSLKFSIFLQSMLAILGLAMIDEGQLFKFSLVAATAYWCTIAIIMIRRNGHATRLDSFLIKWGYPLALPLTAILCAIIPMGILRH